MLMMMRGTILAIISIAGSSAFLFPQKIWNGLEVTFGANVLTDPNVFASLPRTEQAAKTAGWTKIGDCSQSSKFRGIRYIHNKDYAVILLFDVNGYIAGIQSGIVKAGLPAFYPPRKQIGQMFQEDGQHYVLTAYFTDPAIICASGRSSSDFEQHGTGNGLYIQNGSDPVIHSIQMPAMQSGIGATDWTLGRCFPAMGVHYWYNTASDMNCDDFQPMFLLYNEHRLTAFGWAMGVDQASPRFEHPPHLTFGAFMNPVPQCLNDYAKLSTMHIYLTGHPSRNLC